MAASHSPEGQAGPGNESLHVAIIDAFYPGDDAFPSPEARAIDILLNGGVDIDRDRIPEPLYHGDLVALFAQGSGVVIPAYPVPDLPTAKLTILRHLQTIQSQAESGEPFDAVVLCWESSTLISALGKPLDRRRATQYKAELRRWGEEDPSWKLTSEIIAGLEGLVRSGIRVFTIAGNSGRGMVNTYSFAEGVITVGAEEEALRGTFVADNPYVDFLAQSAFHIRRVRNYLGNVLGYDVNEDGVADIPITLLSSYAPGKYDYPEESRRLLKGSSFAAPTEVRRRMALHFACLSQ